MLFLDGKVELHKGDCLDVVRGLADNSIDSVVTDPPYHLTSIVKRFGKPGSAPAKFGSDGAFSRASAGFMGQGWDAPDEAVIDPGFAHWLAGFVDGEGCFSVHKKNVNGCETFDCQFSLTLRADDKPIVVEIQEALGGIGSIADRPARGENDNPQVRFCVSSKKDCQRLRAIFEVFPLRAKKLRDFEIWSQALDEWVSHGVGDSWEDVAYFREKLMAVRRYGSLYHPSQLWSYQWAHECLRVLKPGGHMAVFSGTRTYHRIVSGIEDSGFEIRDQLAWVFGTGFPKSHSVALDFETTLCERVDNKWRYLSDGEIMVPGEWRHPDAVTHAEKGTALKPAWEPICLARKPLSEKTVAANVLRWGTGAINVGACRIENADYDPTKVQRSQVRQDGHTVTLNIPGHEQQTYNPLGRFPANLCHDGSDEVLEAFPETTSGSVKPYKRANTNSYSGGMPENSTFEREGGSGSAVRFFYSAKASKADRALSKHPTVKPVKLMQWLVRLITPPGGVTLDPFAGTGTTGEAAWREGFSAVLVERETEYQADIERRMLFARARPKAERKPDCNPGTLPLSFVEQVA